MQFNSIGRSSNFAQAGKAAADDTLKAFIASRRNAPDYGKIVEKGMENRSAEKRAAISTSAQVHQAGLKAKSGVQADRIVYGARRDLKSAQRKAGALGAAGKMFGSIANAGGEKPLEPYKGRYSRDELNADIDKYSKEAEEVRAGIVEPVKPSDAPSTSTPSPAGGGGGSTNSGGTVSSDISAQHTAGPGQLSRAQIKDYALGAGFSPGNAATVVGIAGGESGFDPSNSTKRSGLYAKTGEDSVGLMQINWGYHKDSGWLQDLGITSREQLLDPATNMKAAKYLYDGRGDFGDWTVYNKGIYKDYL